jgi:hypothetical protein
MVSESLGKRNHSHFRFVNAFDIYQYPKPFTSGNNCKNSFQFGRFFHFTGACEWFPSLKTRETIRISIL